MNDTTQTPRIAAAPPAPDYKGAFDALVARAINRIAARIGSKDMLVAALRPLWTGGILSEMTIRALFLIPPNDKIRVALANVRALDDNQHLDTVGDAAVRLLLVLCEESIRGTGQGGILRDGRPDPCVVSVANLLSMTRENPNKETLIEGQVNNILMQWGTHLSAAYRSGNRARNGATVSNTLFRLFRVMGSLHDYANDPKRFDRIKITSGVVDNSTQPAVARPEQTVAANASVTFQVDITTHGAVEYASRSFPRNYHGDLTMEPDASREFLRLLAQLEWLKRRANDGFDEDDEGTDIDEAIEDAESRCDHFLRDYERNHYWDADNCDDMDSDDDWDNYDSDNDNEGFESSETDYEEAREQILRNFRTEIDAMVREREREAQANT